MRNYWVSLFVVPALVSGLAGSAQGDVLVRYDFGADEATQTKNPATVNVGVTATPITSPSTGFGDNAHVQGPVWWFSYTNPAGGNVLAMPWQGNAYEPAQNGTGGPAYFTFTVTPNAGVPMLLTDLQFKVGTAQSGSFSPNPVFYVNTDVDGFGSTQWIDSGPITAQPAGGALTWQDETVSLAGLQYQLLNSITFRIYYNGNFGPEGLWDNIVLNGIVPEPAALSVLALGGMMVLARRRRQA